MQGGNHPGLGGPQGSLGAHVSRQVCDLFGEGWGRLI